MRVLHGQVREQVKKRQMDYFDDRRLTLQLKTLVMPVLSQKGFVFINLQMVLKDT
jgi:hypothetical protein